MKDDYSKKIRESFEKLNEISTNHIKSVMTDSGVKIALNAIEQSKSANEVRTKVQYHSTADVDAIADKLIVEYGYECIIEPDLNNDCIALTIVHG